MYIKVYEKRLSVYACSTANQLVMIALLIENNLKAVPFKPPVFGSFNCFFKKKIGSVAFRLLNGSMLKEHLELKKIISEKNHFCFLHSSLSWFDQMSVMTPIFYSSM